MIEEYSPWGGIQWSEPLIPGMDLISTASHGGVRVSREAAMYLSPGARKCGFETAASSGLRRTARSR